MNKPVFITTSIAYINAEPHIGFLFELVAADVLARYYKQQGQEVFFLTGTDEHGTKVEQAAKVANLAPQQFADQLAEQFKALGEQFNIDFDHFVRTTDSTHVKFVQEQWVALQGTGVLVKKPYGGWYCTGCEAFKTEAEIENGKCRIHEQPLEKVEEENWFLTISPEQQQTIEAWINRAVFPATRRQEVINVLKDGYTDISVSRPAEKLQWGIPVPGDETQVMYVWIDALLNYLSALDATGKTDLWPADIQLIGKDILKFHAIIWPALLLSLGYELPNKLLVHGFISVDGKKMSKSLGNVVAPKELHERYGVDGTRYLLLRHLNFYDDSNFSWADFDAVYNGELANGLGNLLARVVSLLKRWEASATESSTTVGPSLSSEDFAGELEAINELIKQADGWITAEKPWSWPNGDRAAELVAASNLFELAQRLDPFTPQTAAEIRRQLQELDPKPLFPRLEK
jgi:methionyl-tRNA synthetase